ncbi:Permease of the drug/metabolite transporter (DMT) superfamily [Halogranum amylolyticum]|uniref:Permease of the drug/metabolite transporter (DMT) superfamily n=1 Tax=Halogranum amylolyticum TaxID=660520 RepID=A0A1H8TB77_9EURY|nr:DMT family transporter [Halogranum amylolyticum]SEO88389.1 Permease of the drug/metabolite transporter (DMT) superfamily [Halogranum amylolyticum]
MSRLDRHVPPLAGLAVAVLAVSTSAILVTWSEAPSLVKALYRVLFTTLLLAPVAVARHADDFRKLRLRDVAVAVASGVALAIHFASWFESLEWTTVAASVTLVQAQPLFVAVGAWALLDERVTRRTVVGILVAVVGMIVMSVGDLLSGVAVAAPRPLYGNALAVVGAVAAASYFLAGRSLRQRIALLPYVIVVYTVCTTVLFGLTVAEGHALVGYPPREWLLFLGMAVGPGLLGHTLINWALAHLESSVVSVSLLGEPVGSTLLALVLLGQVPTAATLVGGAVVLGGIYVTAGSDGSADDAADRTERSTTE